MKRIKFHSKKISARRSGMKRRYPQFRFGHSINCSFRFKESRPIDIAMQRAVSSLPQASPSATCCLRKRSRRTAVKVLASTSNGAPRSTSISKLINELGTLVVPGCYDALSAMILAQAGHRAAYVSGAAVTASMLGEPDLSLLTPSEMASRSSGICGSVPGFPVIVDADTGGGSILNVQRTIRLLMASGASGCLLEDQTWPKRIGYVRNKEIIHREEFVAKILAAREVIGDSDFFLIARTDARSASAKYGLEDAIGRANLYIDAGADAQLVGGLRSVEELKIVAEKTHGLRVANMVEGGVTPLCSGAQLGEMGFHMAVFPLSAMFMVARALQDVYGTLAEHGTSQALWEDMVSWRALNSSILGIEEKYAVDEHFTAIQGPASSIDQRLRVKVKGLVKSVSVPQ